MGLEQATKRIDSIKEQRQKELVGEPGVGHAFQQFQQSL
jgi:hypothetical protein